MTRAPASAATVAGVSGTPVWIAVSELGCHRVQIFEGLSGSYVGQVGTPRSPGGASNQLYCPRGVAFFNDTLFVADCDNHRVQAFHMGSWSFRATVLGVASGGASARGSEPTKLAYPNLLAVDEATSILYCCDNGNRRVTGVSVAAWSFGKVVGSMGTDGQGDGQFMYPQGVCVDSMRGVLYCTDYHQMKIQVWSSFSGDK